MASNKQAAQIVIPLGGELSLAAVGTALPTTVDEPLNAEFKGMGWATDEGIKIAQEKTTLDIGAWGAGGAAVVSVTTARKFTFGGTMLQSNAFNFMTYFGSTDFASDGADGYRADIEISAPAIEFALVIEYTMQGYPIRLPFKRVSLAAEGDLTIVDSDAQKLGYSMTSMVPDSGSILGSILTSHPAFAPAGP